MILRAWTRLKKFLGVALLTVAACTITFVAIEGASSWAVLFYKGYFLPEQVFPSNYVRSYDELLGWTNTPSGRAEGTFGPGTRITVNSQSFRAESDYTFDVPHGKLRIICSGDSFTFGFGVSDHDTWCHQLTRIDQRLETINMGVGGYGIDQSYLRYERDGRPFQHDVHLFTFITEDFWRMRNSSFGFYGKPTLRLSEGALAVEGVPVFRLSYPARLMTNLSTQTDRLRSIELGKAVFSRVWGSAAQQGLANDDEIRILAMRVFEELQRLNRAKQSVLILVYLPIATDYYKRDSNVWREYLKKGALERRIPFLDVVERFRSLPAEDVERLYLRPWDGHFSPRGNEYVARFLREQIGAMPQFAGRFRQASVN